mmetsp:Transcript_10994/g.17005  ORF Transcript_10994/g.17005 Transcript_10994/m.17005 type:complete len:315 (-) Transcript_10994:83-1027(-)
MSPTTSTSTNEGATEGATTSTSSGWSLALGSCIGGIPVRLHYTYFLILIIELVSGLQYNEPKYLALVFCMFGPILFITILIHEYGHAICTQKLGGTVEGIMLWPLGGLAFCGPTQGSVKEDLYVALAGPLTHIPQAAVWFGVFAVVTEGDLGSFDRYINLSELREGGADVFFKFMALQSIGINVGLFIFNLFIPAYPLDGGRCFAALLVMCGVRVQKAAYRTSILAILIGLGMGIYGAMEYIRNDSPNGLFVVLICVFIIMNSYQLFSMTKAGRVLQHPLFSRQCYRETEQEAERNQQQQQQGGSPTEIVAEMT